MTEILRWFRAGRDLCAGFAGGLNKMGAMTYVAGRRR